MSAATTPATDAEIAALKAAAERATKGEWVVVHERDRAPEVSVHIPCSDGGSWWIATVYDAAKGVSAADNAAYIALANPSTILALLARLDAAERERDEWANAFDIEHDAHVACQNRAERLAAALDEAADELASCAGEMRTPEGQAVVHRWARKARAALAAERGEAQGGEHGRE